MKTLPTLRHFEYFAALAEHGNFRRAAESCHVTQPALSSGIRELETIIGLPLIDRAAPGRTITLTPLGQRALRDGKEALDKISALMHEAGAMKSPHAWPVRIGVIPTIAPYLLPVLLGGLQKKRPGLNLSLHEATTGSILEQLHQGALDMALMAFPYDTGELKTRLLFEENFYCAVPRKSNPFEGRKTLSLEDLSGKKILLLEDGHCLRDHALAACRLQPSKEKQTFRAASLPTLIQMVAQGYGITLLPEMALPSARESRALKILPFRKDRPSRTIGLAWRGDAPMQDSLTQLAESIHKILKDKHYTVSK